jgi:hypothetical protein
MASSPRIWRTYLAARKDEQYSQEGGRCTPYQRVLTTRGMVSTIQQIQKEVQYSQVAKSGRRAH